MRSNTPGTVPHIINKNNNTTPHRSIRFQNVNIISQEVINFLTEKVYYQEDGHVAWTWPPHAFLEACPTESNKNLDVNIEHFCAPVVHPITKETITSYNKLIKNPVLKPTWTTQLGKDFGNLAQGNK